MKCKDCEHFKIKYYGIPPRQSFDGWKCGLTGERTGENTFDPDCPKNKKAKKKDIDPNDEYVRIG